MRTKALAAPFCFLMSLVLILLSFPPLSAEGYDYTVGEVSSFADGIVAYKLGESGAGDVQSWIDGGLSESAGVNAEWYVVGLSQSGYSSFSSYEDALKSYLDSNSVSSATSREKYALCLAAAGSSDRYISDILDSSIGQQGIMSWIYGLHVLNNGYTCQSYSSGDCVSTLLSMQYADGGWALFGENGDIDVTAMTIQALAPHYAYNSDVQAAVDSGLEFLSSKQDSNGGYSSFGSANAESTAQVLTALSALGIDCQQDDRFIKEGGNIIDGLLMYRLGDGSFCHNIGGGYSDSATVQAFYSLVAYRRALNGQSPLFILDNAVPVSDEPSSGPAQNTSEPGNKGGDTSGEEEPGQEEGPPADGGLSEMGISQGVHHNVPSGGRTTAPYKKGTVNTLTTAVSTLAGGTVSGSTDKTHSGTAALTDDSTEEQSSGTVTAVKTGKEKFSSAKKGSYKPKVILIIIGAGALLSLLIFALGKRSYKNFIFVGLAVAAGIIIVLATDVKSPDEYYNGEAVHKENAIGTVTLEIRCDTAVGKLEADYIPEDGVVLPEKTFEIAEGDTVFEILNEAAQTYGIQVENTGSSANAHGMVYIAGINYLYEYALGDLSGWVYHVNGISPSRGCGDYVLSDGDKIEWLYTCDLGRDLDEVYEE